MPENSSKTIFNSSPLINLAKINSLYLIEELFSQIIIPPAVRTEVIAQARDKDESSDIKELIDKNIIVIKEVENQTLVKTLQTNLDLGESEVIALALEINADLVVIDEMEARETADNLEINKTGFLGIIIKAHNKNIIDSGITLIDSAIEKGFYISDSLYDILLQKLGE